MFILSLLLVLLRNQEVALGIQDLPTGAIEVYRIALDLMVMYHILFYWIVSYIVSRHIIMQSDCIISYGVLYHIILYPHRLCHWLYHAKLSCTVQHCMILYLILPYPSLSCRIRLYAEILGTARILWIKMDGKAKGFRSTKNLHAIVWPVGVARNGCNKTKNGWLSKWRKAQNSHLNKLVLMFLLVWMGKKKV